jgi:hypothetical protein
MRALLLVCLLPLAACFQYDEPDCSFKCGTDTSAPVCPDDYECRSDGYCHLQGSAPTSVCPYTDASVVADQSIPLDMTSPSSDGATDL